jgi:prepilin-type N-terminal cleavage/methylation domain-containing protein
MFIPEQAVMVKKAFTLIEVLVVVMIIGIISLGVFFGFSGFTTSSKEATVKKNHENVCKFIEGEVTKCNRLKAKSVLGGEVPCPTKDADLYFKPWDGNGPLEKALRDKIINPYTKTSGLKGFGYRFIDGKIEQGVTFINNTHVGTNIDYEGIQVTTCYKSGGCGYAQRLENSPINFAGANTSSEAGMCLIKLNY